MIYNRLCSPGAAASGPQAVDVVHSELACAGQLRRARSAAPHVLAPVPVVEPAPLERGRAALGAPHGADSAAPARALL